MAGSNVDFYQSVARFDRRTTLWFAGTVIFLLLTALTAGLWLFYYLYFFSGVFTTFFAIAAAYCAYRLGRRWYWFEGY
jgi:hypothetical protein